MSDSEIEAMVDEILSSSAEATPQADLQSTNIQELFIPGNLAVLGVTSLADTSVAGTFNVDGSLFMADTSINTLNGAIYIQNLGQGGVDILAGKIVIDTHGDATFEGNITVKGSLFANMIRPLDNQDLTINLENHFDEATTQPSFGKLLVQGINREIVASIDSSGSANLAGNLIASGSGTFQKIVIAEGFQGTGLSAGPTEIEINATAGEAILPVDQTELTIISPFITDKTLVYITPTTSTNNQVLYIKAKKAAEGNLIPGTSPGGTSGASLIPGWFTVAVDKAPKTDIKFNFWLIN